MEAGYFILLAGVFDSLDGVMARLTRSTSRFGVEIDSLSDVISSARLQLFSSINYTSFNSAQLGSWSVRFLLSSEVSAWLDLMFNWLDSIKIIFADFQFHQVLLQ